MAFQFTQADIFEARKHAKNPNPDSGRISLLLLVILVALLYGTPPLLNWAIPSPPAPAMPWIKAASLAVVPWIYVIGWLFAVSRFNTPRTIRAQWKSGIYRHGAYQAHLTNDGLAFESDRTSSFYRWGVFLGLRESPNLLLLRIGDGNVVMLPKRGFLAGVDLDSLRRWISVHINPLALPFEEFAAQHPPESAELLLDQLHFTCTKADLIAVRRQWHPRWLRMLISLGVFVVSVAVLVPLMLLADQLAWPVGDGWGFVVLMVVLFAVQIIWDAGRFAWMWRRARQLHGPQAVDVTEMGLRFTTQQQSDWIGWGALRESRQTSKMFVLVTRDSALRLIPKNAFPTPQSVQIFASLLQDRITPAAGFAVLPR